MNAEPEPLSDLVLEVFNARPELNPNPAQVLVTTFDAQTAGPSIRLAGQWRREGLQVEWYPRADRLAKQLKVLRSFSNRNSVE